MIRRNMDRNQGNNQHRKFSDATQSARADSNGLQTMIRRNMDRNSATVAPFAGQIGAITCRVSERRAGKVKRRLCRSPCSS